MLFIREICLHRLCFLWLCVHQAMSRLWGYNHLLQWSTAAAAAKSLQSCPTLCNPNDSSPPGSPVPGILQARTLEWVAISFSNAWKWKVKVKSLSCVRLLVTPWTAAHHAPPSMDFPGKSTGVGCHCLLLQWSRFTPNQRNLLPPPFYLIENTLYNCYFFTLIYSYP